MFFKIILIDRSPINPWSPWSIVKTLKESKLWELNVALWRPQTPNHRKLCRTNSRKSREPRPRHRLERDAKSRGIRGFSRERSRGCSRRSRRHKLNFIRRVICDSVKMVALCMLILTINLSLAVSFRTVDLCWKLATQCCGSKGHCR